MGPPPNLCLHAYWLMTWSRGSTHLSQMHLWTWTLGPSILYSIQVESANIKFELIVARDDVICSHKLIHWWGRLPIYVFMIIGSWLGAGRRHIWVKCIFGHGPSDPQSFILLIYHGVSSSQMHVLKPLTNDFIPYVVKLIQWVHVIFNGAVHLYHGWS